MKSNKIYAFLLAAMVFAGCSDEDEISWNSQDATIGMGEVEFICKENKNIVSVPIVVEGNRNGAIEVTVDVAEYGENPAMANVHYFLTSNKIIIPADATTGEIEFRVVDDNDINESPRTFVVTLKSVKGKATIAADAKNTVVVIKDNDSQLYERLQGRWKMTSDSEYLGALSWKVNIIGAEEGAEGYNEVLQVTGLAEYEGTSMTLQFNYDNATKKGYVYIPFGTLLAKGTDIGFEEGYEVKTATFDSKNNFITTGGIYGYWNEDFTEITFDKGQALYAWVYYNGSPTADSFLFDCSNIKLKK